MALSLTRLSPHPVEPDRRPVGDRPRWTHPPRHRAARPRCVELARHRRTRTCPLDPALAADARRWTSAFVDSPPDDDRPVKERTSGRHALRRFEQAQTGTTSVREQGSHTVYKQW